MKPMATKAVRSLLNTGWAYGTAAGGIPKPRWAAERLSFRPRYRPSIDPGRAGIFSA